MEIPTAVQRQFDLYFAKAKQIWPTFVAPTLVLKTNGQTAGWARWRPGSPPSFIIDLNQTFMLSHTKDMLEDTIPHEMAHVLVWQRYGTKVAPHGAEWYAMYGALTGNCPRRCHDYGDVAQAKQTVQDKMTAMAEKMLKDMAA